MSGAGPRDRGQRFEDFALGWLQKRGLRVLARNYVCRLGELDLVMQDQEILVIVEVKFRRPGALVSGPESVTRAKQARLGRAAAHFLQRHPDLHSLPVRFDLLTVTGPARERQVDWIRDAFRPRL